MSTLKYYSNAKEINPVLFPGIPEDARAVSAQIDGATENCCFFNQVGWYKKPFKADGLIKHDCDELLVFASGKVDDPENLNAEIEIQIENDILNITNTSVVFVPAGTAHGNLHIKSMDYPVFYFVCHINTGSYGYLPASATAEKGSFTGNVVERYERVNGTFPNDPENIFGLLLWIDGAKVENATYMETLFIKGERHVPGPNPHAHDDFDELIGFIGSDPYSPADLGAEVYFAIEGESLEITESCIGFLPRDLAHGPMTIPKMSRPIYHFTLGNKGAYKR